MRIGYVVKMFPRISETFILNEILELENQGAEVTIFSLKKPNEGKYHPQIGKLKAEIIYLEDFDVKKWPQWIAPQWDFLGLHNKKIWALLNQALESNDTSRIDAIWRAAWVAAKSASLQIDRLHAHFASLPSTIAYLANRICDIPFSFTAHAKDIFVYDIDEHYLREKMRYVSFVVTVTNYNKNYFIQEIPEVDAQRIKVLYNGVDINALQAVNNDERDRNTILGVGRLVEKKGFDNLLKALKLLKEEKLEFNCVIVGTGPEQEKLLELSESLQLSKNVNFVGSKTSDEVVALMKKASIFCLPCVIAQDKNMDALPTVLLEALAVGLPSISTTISGIPEIIEHEHNGLLASPENPVQLASQIKRLLTSLSLQQEFARNGRKVAENKFSLERNAGKLFQLFKEAHDNESQKREYSKPVGTK